MEIIPGLIMPLWAIILILSAVTAIIIFVLIKLLLNFRFLKTCDKACSDEELLNAFLEKYPPAARLRKARLIQRASEKNEGDFIASTGLDILWEERLRTNRRISDLKKLLKYYPDRGLFYCLEAGPSKPGFGKILAKKTADSSDELLLKRIAIAGKGTDFSGKYAASLIPDQLQNLLEMTGDPEWEVRFFALKLLIHYSDKRAERAGWEAFKDPAFRIRAALAAEFKTADKKMLGKHLLELLKDDPSFIVRTAARRRLDNDYPEFYRIDTGDLNKTQLFHVLEQLHDDSKEDENTALQYLISDDMEIRLQAAVYLQRQNALSRLFIKADLGDREGYKRVSTLLANACDVNCTNFLEKIGTVENPASIMLAADLLKQNGSRKFVDYLAERIFAPTLEANAKEAFIELYASGVECIALRGSDDALRLMDKELKKSADDPVRLSILLKALPERGEDIFIPTLINFLTEGNFCKPDLLRHTIERFAVSTYLEVLISILHNEGGGYEDNIRKEAFKILGELKMPCCLQVILENLTILSPGQQQEFAALLAEYAPDVFEERVSDLLESVDAAVKAALISSLPATGMTSFVKTIKDAAGDSDPEVRIAGVRALAGFGETKVIGQMTAMLRDPVERVRMESAEVIAASGPAAALTELEKIIKDPNEVDPVKKAAVIGLGYSEREESVGILVNLLKDPDLADTAVQALSVKKPGKLLKLLLEYFKDASPEVRDRIAESFKLMGSSIEPEIVSILKENITSLHGVLADILLKTGYIDTTMKKLLHRNPDVRKDAAAVLSLIKTKEAFKGIVLASRDPDQNVRVEVLKALEMLNTKEGKPILEELKNDPDKRVRKYTLWALERLDAKSE